MQLLLANPEVIFFLHVDYETAKIITFYWVTQKTKTWNNVMSLRLSEKKNGVPPKMVINID